MSAVLIVADRAEDAQVAIPRGMALAAKLGLTAEVVAFCYESLASIGGDAQQKAAKEALIAHCRGVAEQAVEAARPDGLKVKLSVVWKKDVSSWIDHRCAEKAFAAVVKTVHRSGTFLYTSTDWHLLRSCPAPVLIAAAKKWRSTKPIVAAVDLGTRLKVKQRLNESVVAIAKQYAEALDCPLYLVNALHISAVLRELDLIDEHHHVRKLKDEMKPQVTAICKKFGLSAEQCYLKEGPADKVITSEAARLKAQLVVLGTVGRKGIRAKLMGNTAEQVLTRLRTDVLAIKP